MALPRIVTDIRGCRQTVDHEVNGLLVPVCEPHALAAALDRLLRSPEERSRFGAASREKALAEFDERRVFAMLVESYRRLVGEHRLDQSA
jgi:glycosyltransferase involved in cell wall biosynthesis